MELGSQILMLANVLISIVIVIGSIWYFKIVKDQYRWIKLFWGLEMLAYTVLLVWALLGGNPSQELQLIIMLLPVTCLLYGLVSAFSRLKEMRSTITILEARLEQNNKAIDLSKT